ncbi:MULTISPECIES: PLP-dependent aminotransferase family protein [unclassified Streptomyces]|uniref:MocR-like transcription factor YczR n=1 Tax=unclassified Streptomyces TaxID=2593676 RepID=UPI000883BF5E|nr:MULTISPECIES: PLP-dependent aminotransferase family protein [unclassified Streptomyces]PBC86957.1 DNA-binding transcriptional MocR family regulator [Streptomyces sp. 2321.6]SDQ66540.1 DNA-binding transcriptional regulator, MocR family, contains an aminotransferase domain [Streptomyces sp. KS_16]SED34624.1 DNA-binding transcriptional regulator, MocR family, contains an aminotransferase domain [Streptomyces sp. 2112.3]SEE14836.1 DNA-binding transcriptional regulator, MocR family, contains an a
MADRHRFPPSDRADRADRAGRTLGSRQLAAMLPDPAEARPAYRHLARAIGALILDGRIALHVRLPAERELATALHTSRATVTAAYDLLRESGYAHSRQGSGTWTALPEGRAPSGIARLLGPQDTAIDLASAAPGLPEQALLDALTQVTPRLAEHAHTPGYHPYGLPELRAAVAERFTRRGLATMPEQILVTAGAQHALTLVLGLLCRPGDRVMVENPSYPNALEAMRRARLRTLSVPVTDTGWDIEITESTFRQAIPQLAYLLPDFHNPTGCLMPDEERVRILRAAERSGAWLVVDETLADLALDVPAPPPFASRATPGGAGQVITIGSMSKTHWGGLRMGWVRAPARLVTELAGQRVATDMGGSVLDQLLAVPLLARAGELLPARLEQLRRQRAALAAALAEHLPQWTWQLPPGGLSLWVDLGAPLASALAERALDYGVRIEGGAYFGADPGLFEQRLRIPYTTSPETLREAVHRMAAALAGGLSPSSATRRAHWVA